MMIDVDVKYPAVDSFPDPAGVSFLKKLPFFVQVIFALIKLTCVVAYVRLQVMLVFVELIDVQLHDGG